MDVHGETNGLGIFFCVCLGDPTIYKVYLKKKKWLLTAGWNGKQVLKASISSHKRPYSNKCPPPNKPPPPPPIIVWNKHPS